MFCKLIKDKKMFLNFFIFLLSQVQLLQEQMDALADTRSAGEERYARAKQENATLQARVLMLEEAQRDAETRAEERLQVRIIPYSLFFSFRKNYRFLYRINESLKNQNLSEYFQTMEK